MKLFDTFEAVKFPEEDMIFITRGGYLYYIYNPKYKWWRKHSNAGNDHLTVSNYPDVSREELTDAMIERIIDLNPELSDKDLKQLIADKYASMKTRKVISLKPVEDRFKDIIDKYMNQIKEVRLK